MRLPREIVRFPKTVFRKFTTSGNPLIYWLCRKRKKALFRLLIPIFRFSGNSDHFSGVFREPELFFGLFFGLFGKEVQLCETGTRKEDVSSRHYHILKVWCEPMTICRKQPQRCYQAVKTIRRSVQMWIAARLMMWHIQGKLLRYHLTGRS